MNTIEFWDALIIGASGIGLVLGAMIATLGFFNLADYSSRNTSHANLMTSISVSLAGLCLFVLCVISIYEIADDNDPRCYNGEIIPEGTSVIVDRGDYQIQIGYRDLEKCE